MRMRVRVRIACGEGRGGRESPALQATPGTSALTGTRGLMLNGRPAARPTAASTVPAPPPTRCTPDRQRPGRADYRPFHPPTHPPTHGSTPARHPLRCPHEAFTAPHVGGFLGGVWEAVWGGRLLEASRWAPSHLDPNACASAQGYDDDDGAAPNAQAFPPAPGPYPIPLPPPGPRPPQRDRPDLRAAAHAPAPLPVPACLGHPRCGRFVIVQPNHLDLINSYTHKSKCKMWMRPEHGVWSFVLFWEGGDG